MLLAPSFSFIHIVGWLLALFHRALFAILYHLYTTQQSHISIWRGRGTACRKVYYSTFQVLVSDWSELLGNLTLKGVGEGIRNGYVSEGWLVFPKSQPVRLWGERIRPGIVHLQEQALSLECTWPFSFCEDFIKPAGRLHQLPSQGELPLPCPIPKVISLGTGRLRRKFLAGLVLRLLSPSNKWEGHSSLTTTCFTW